MAEFEYTPDAQSPAARAANARAFSNWLVYEWLAGYPRANVAVFDYYNVLTSNGGSADVNDLGQASGNHHRWRNGEVEHIQDTDNDFSSYPSGDSHPSTAGHTKATAQFVPLLNVYYNRWQAGAPAPPTPAQPAPTAGAEPGIAEDTATTGATVVADWEAGNDWEAYGDGQGSSVVSERDAAVAHGGTASLRIAYDILSEGWGDCDTSFEEPQDWSGSDGLEMWLRADAPGQEIGVALLCGDIESPTPFFAWLETPAEGEGDWTQVLLPWASFSRAEWAEEGGPAELDPGRVVGLGFSFDPGEGTLWVDDVALYKADAQPDAGQQAGPGVGAEEQPGTEQQADRAVEDAPAPAEEEGAPRVLLPCASLGALFWLAMLLRVYRRR
jgi:hypothetical protein